MNKPEPSVLSINSSGLSDMNREARRKLAKQMIPRNAARRNIRKARSDFASSLKGSRVKTGESSGKLPD